MNARRLFLFSLMVCICGAVPTLAQSTGSLRLVSAQALSDLIPGQTTFEDAVISPDGATIAWVENEGLCLFALASASVTCDTWPEGFSGKPYVDSGGSVSLCWSPDSQQLVFSENFFIYLLEPDIWVYNVAESKFQDLTDDGLAGGRAILEGSDTHPALLDYLPTWNPANGDLYFFRSVRKPDVITFGLYHIPAGGSDPILVADYTNQLPAPYPVFLHPAISPDGSQIAMIVLSQRRDSPDDGLWVVQLADGTLSHVVTLDDFNAFVPTFGHAPALPMAVIWARQGLVITAFNAEYSADYTTSNTFYLDTASRTLTPLVDWSQFSSLAALLQPQSDGHTPIFLLPRSGIVLPLDDLYLYLHADLRSETATISSLPLPFDGSAPTDLGEVSQFAYRRTVNGSISDDGIRAILYDYLLTFDRG